MWLIAPKRCNTISGKVEAAPQQRKGDAEAAAETKAPVAEAEAAPAAHGNAARDKAAEAEQSAIGILFAAFYYERA